MPFNRIDTSIVRRGKRSYFNCFSYGVSTKYFILGIDFSSWCYILLLCVVKRRGTQIIKKWHFYCLHGTNFGFKWIMIFGPYYGHKNYFRNIIFKWMALSFKTILVNTYQLFSSYKIFRDNCLQIYQYIVSSIGIKNNPPT